MAETLDRLKTFNATHDILDFGSAVRDEWLLLAYQELVRDAWPFMEALKDKTSGTMKELCEEWLSAHARTLRKGLVE